MLPIHRDGLGYQTIPIWCMLAGLSPAFIPASLNIGLRQVLHLSGDVRLSRYKWALVFFSITNGPNPSEPAPHMVCCEVCLSLSPLSLLLQSIDSVSAGELA